MCSVVRFLPRWLLALAILSAAAPAQTLAHKGWAGNGIVVEPWWRSAVLYQIDPVSFQDSNGDGFGDLRGIVNRLDYLQALGVDALVLSPFELQPPGSEHPFDPANGSEEDFDALIQEATRRKLRVLVDLPLNSSNTSAELTNAARFWLSRGVAGLRLISAPSPAASRASASAPQTLAPAQIADRLRELERACATYPGERVLFWDLRDPPPQPTPRRRTRHAEGAAAALRDPAAGPAPQSSPQLVADRRLAVLPGWNPVELRRVLAPPLLAMPVSAPVLNSDSPDLPRSFDRLADSEHAAAVAHQLAAVLLLSRGAALLYFGQEIGMATRQSSATSAPSAPPADPASGDPAPMQWGAVSGAVSGADPGFTSGVPWVPPGPNAATANVAAEDADPGSLLNFYRKLAALRHASAALRSGALILLNEPNPDILAWVRIPRPGAGVASAPVLVVLNVSARPATISLTAELRRAGVETGSGILRTLAQSGSPDSAGTPGAVLNTLSVPAFGVYAGELKAQPGLESAPAPVRRSSRSTRSR